MPIQIAQPTNDVLGPERGIQQSEAVQLPQPLAVLHIGLASRYMPNMTGVDQIHFDAGCFQLKMKEIKQGLGAVDAVGFGAEAVKWLSIQ